MARIIESATGNRRIIKLSTDDVISVVREYQNVISKKTEYFQTRNLLEDTVIYIPEDI